MPRPLAAWRRIPVPTRDDALGKGSPYFQDRAGSYLCSVGLVLLNRRHLADLPPLVSGNKRHHLILARALRLIALAAFTDAWDDDEPGDAKRSTRYRLDRTKLLDGIPAKASWVLAKWNPEKVEGRRRGGRHGAAQGVRKGKPPRWVPGILAHYAHLPDRERKAAAIAEFGFSESTYYKLWKAYQGRPTPTEEQALAGVAFDRSLAALLPDGEPWSPPPPASSMAEAIERMRADEEARAAHLDLLEGIAL